ncbi:MAG: SPOR domain-containing protein [Cellulophaga sp.]|nr:SPOR domain-containing protein [Cellulophaga sp.]
MKIAFNILIFTFFGYYANAQVGNISIQQDDRINKLIDLYKSFDESTDGYEIQIYNGMFNTANQNKANFENDFPDWKCKIVHVDVDYRVRITGIKTALEAQRKYNEVRKKYPAAIIISPK